MGIILDFICSRKMLIPSMLILLLLVIAWLTHCNSYLKNDNFSLKQQVTNVTTQFAHYQCEANRANKIAAEAEAKKIDSTKASDDTTNIINQALTINKCFASAAPQPVIEQLRQLASPSRSG